MGRIIVGKVVIRLRMCMEIQVFSALQTVSIQAPVIFAQNVILRKLNNSLTLFPGFD